MLSWNWDFLHDVIKGTEDRVPAMTDAVLKFINKYHTAHFGFDLNRGGMKLKNTLSNAVERAYHESPVSFGLLHNTVEKLAGHGSQMYRQASDSFTAISVQDLTQSLPHMARRVIELGEYRFNLLVDAVTQLLRDTKFTVPGLEQRISALEALQQAGRSVSRAADRARQRFASLMEKISDYIRNIEFTISGTEVVIRGNEIMDRLQSSVTSAYDLLREGTIRFINVIYSTLIDHSRVIAEKADNLLSNLKDKNLEMSPQVESVFTEIQHFSRQNTNEATRHVADAKDHIKLIIQEAYNALTMDEVNGDIVAVINIFESHLYGGLNEFVAQMRRASENTAPYVRVSNASTDIEIPLPFHWKSFSHWPTQYRQ